MGKGSGAVAKKEGNAGEEEGDVENALHSSACVNCLMLEVACADPAVSFLPDPSYFKKLMGVVWFAHSPHVSVGGMWWSWLGAFLGIGVVGVLSQYVFAPLRKPMIFGCLGALAVLLYATPSSPLAQPRNVLGGHFFSAIIGVSMSKLSRVMLVYGADLTWLAAALAVSVSIVAMQLTKTVHPPGSATAIIAVISGEDIQQMGYFYVLMIMFAVSLMIAVSMLIENIPVNRRYPVALC
eukprot:TRINITY_DN2563_c0_g1_i1.p1 TRINITY_DN2563_c0_g1~~TRINITY_DN2563_c0_g1_i1.p1  ORF type:complete len:238 (+),score=70.98 TRINITY_DN2563_c0_g1_i1:278-991(+)